MRYTLKKFLYTACIMALLLSLSACSEESPPDDPPDAAPPEEAYTTCEVPAFGIEFDVPAGFGGEADPAVLSEDEARVSVKSGEKLIMVTCSRAASLDEAAELLTRGGVDSSVLYEEFMSLDLAAAAAGWQRGFETFELLDSASGPDSYGCSYSGTYTDGTTSYGELGYRYKNYGGFSDDGGVIRVEVMIAVPQDADREDFAALCQTVTGSLRTSEPGSDPPPPPAESGGTALRPLTGGTGEEQCGEIVAMFFDGASFIRYGGDASAFMALIGGNEDLFQLLQEPGELLSGTRSFMSDWAFQSCEKDGGAEGAYQVGVRETRSYDEEEMGTHEYAHAFSIVIDSPASYRVAGLDSEYIGPVDNGYVEFPAGEESGPSAISIHDEGNSVFSYKGPAVEDVFILDADGKMIVNSEYVPPELEAQRTYGANAQIRQDIFEQAFYEIVIGDIWWASMNQIGEAPTDNSVNSYRMACVVLELQNAGYTETPLYELASYRHLAAVMNQNPDYPGYYYGY